MLRRMPTFEQRTALYSFNVPRYFCTHVRAREFAKQSNVQLSWCYAKNVPLHPGDRDLHTHALQNKLMAWLRIHDQETSHLPSVYPLANPTQFWIHTFLRWARNSNTTVYSVLRWARMSDTASSTKQTTPSETETKSKQDLPRPTSDTKSNYTFGLEPYPNRTYV